jgi:hypothetical protein
MAMEEPHATDAAAPTRSVSVVQILAIGIPAFLSWILLALLSFVSLARAEEHFAGTAPVVTKQIIEARHFVAPAALLVSMLGCFGASNRWAVAFLFVVLPVTVCVAIILAVYIPAQDVIEYQRRLHEGRAPAIWDFFW